MDKETGKILTQGQELKELTGSPGWKTAKTKLFSQLAELDSIATLDFTKPGIELADEIKNRESVRQIIVSWIQSIEGEADSHDYQADIMSIKKEEEEIIKIHGD